MQSSPTLPGADWEEELDLLVSALPPKLVDATRRLVDLPELLEIVIDLGRDPEARLASRTVLLSHQPITPADLEYVAARVGNFGADNRAGIERTLHRISAIRNREGRIVGLTCRVGRAVTGTVDIIKDIVVSGQSILLLGRPGVGKTTMLRECARVLADEMRQRVVIVDTSNEIGGDGDIPHPGIGRARRMQVQTPIHQHQVMIEAVENHMPEVIVIDEIGTELEAAAARTIAERGVQLIATAHGNTLDNLLNNPTLNDLLGGIQSVTLSDEEARRRGTQKSVLERKAPPTFDVLVEIQDRDRVTLNMPLAAVVDANLRGTIVTPRIRIRTGEGILTAAADHKVEVGQGGALARRRKASSVFAYGISRSYLDQAMRELALDLKILPNPDQADLVLTLKNYYRRRPDSIRHAESNGVPVHIVASNTVALLKESLGRIFGDGDQDLEQAALHDALEGIEQVRASHRTVELGPRNAYLRRLQHQLVERHDLYARSTGKEPQRRLRIYLRPTE